MPEKKEAVRLIAHSRKKGAEGDIGAVIEVSPADAKYLVERKAAVRVKAKKPAAS